MEENEMRLGQQISLSGFRELDGGSILILKKIIGNHVKKFSDRSSDFQELKLVMKKIHNTNGGDVFEIKGQVCDKGNIFSAEHCERNVFVTVNKVMSKLEQAMGIKE